MPGEPFTWPVEGVLSSLAAEAVVAGYYAARDAETVWYGGNNRGVDVVSGDERVDVKSAFRMDVRTSEGKQLCLGFMGSTSRTVEAREYVTHYWLVEIAAAGDFTTNGAVVTLDAKFAAEAYKFTRDQINSLFERAWTKRGGSVGRGANLYIPYGSAQSYKINLA